MNGIIFWEFIESRGAEQVTSFNRYFAGTNQQITDEMNLIRSTGKTSGGVLVGAASPRMRLAVSSGRIDHPGYPNSLFGALYEISDKYAASIATRDAITDAEIDPVTGEINLTT